MNVALTGATGFVGSHVLTELLKHGHEVTALVRDDARADTRLGPQFGDSGGGGSVTCGLVVGGTH
jgi:uncharacterized protein YbjT (DUF2867 family)